MIIVTTKFFRNGFTVLSECSRANTILAAKEWCWNKATEIQAGTCGSIMFDRAQIQLVSNKTGERQILEIKA